MALKEKVKRKSLDLAKKLEIIKKSDGKKGKNPKCKRMKPPQSPILEASLLNWIRNVRSQDKPVTGDLLKVSFLRLKFLWGGHLF